MSLFFRSRPGPPRKLRRKSAGKALHKTPVPMLDLGPGPIPTMLPGTRVAPAPVRHTPKRRQRAIGYGTTGAPGQRMFRVT
jgi:hypothetical protein